MPAPRITFTSLGGLQTTPGLEGFKPGACSVLKNLRPVAPNRLRGIAKFDTPAQGGTNGAEPVRTIELANGKSIVIQYTSGGEYKGYGDNVTANLYSYPSYVPSSGQLLADRIFPLIARERVILNGNYGTMVSDFVDPDFSIAFARTWRSAGLPQPQISSITEAAGSTIPTGVIVTYAALIRREYTDGYTLTSQPSVFIKRLNDSGASVDNTVRVNWIYSQDVRQGDVVELYRTNGISGATYATDSGNQCFLVASKIVSSTDATNKYTDLVDLQRMAAPLYETYGTELYTNGDATQENNQPPVCAAQCTWQTTTFYGAITEDPVLTLDPKATVGNLTTAWERANGLGTRSGAGTVTGGSATITAIGAADLVGVKVGQLWAGSALIFPATARVTAVGATTITMNTTALGPSASFSVCDNVNIDGVDYKFGGWGNLAQSIALAAYWELHTSSTIANELTTEEGVTATIRPIRHAASTFAAKVTNAQNYNGNMFEYTGSAYTYARQTQGNLLRFSKANQPEAVPYVNELRVGLGTITSVHATTGYVYICCTDGVYWLTGTEGNFRAEPLDQSLIVSSPTAASAMNERVYAYSNRGFVTFDTAGVVPLSKGVVEDLIPGLPYSQSSSPFVQCHADAEEVWVLIPGSTAANASTSYLYSARYNMFSQLELAGSDALVRSLSLTRSTSSSLPMVAAGLYTSAGAAPRYAKFNGSGAPLSITALLREAGDTATVKQWIDFSVIFDRASAGEVTRSLVNSSSPLGTATMTATRTDARANFGISRSDAVRPQLAAGLAVEAPTRLIDVLGLSFRVVPKTTQSEIR